MIIKAGIAHNGYFLEHIRGKYDRFQGFGFHGMPLYVMAKDKLGMTIKDLILSHMPRVLVISHYVQQLLMD